MSNLRYGGRINSCLLSVSNCDRHLPSGVESSAMGWGGGDKAFLMWCDAPR